MKFLVMIITVWVSMETTNSLSYPIFGTKRYHRGASPRTEMAQHILRQPVYESGYLTNNGYYYYPHHEYHSYGMPTYRGEYKPKAYYYSSGPSYNYYNDREPVSNPLDDLHEEILQENEQERQTDILGDEDYEEEYYMEPSETPHDVYTNNFLRNMIDYNRQKEKHQRLQQLHHQQREHLNEDIEAEEQHPIDDDYFSEMEVNPDDYQFEPKGEDNFDLQKYWDAEMSSLANGATPNDVHHQREMLTAPNNDEDVEELKSLTKHEMNNEDDDYKKRYHVKVKQGQFPHSTNYKQQQTLEPTLPQQKENEEDYSSIDYDDGSWINWDRKRSSLGKNARATNNKKHFVPELTIRKRLLAAPKKDQENSENKSVLRITAMTTKSPVSIMKAFGQKEKYTTVGTSPNSAAVSEKQNVNYQDSINDHRKSPTEIEQNIYDTIKQMIRIEQKLKKIGTKKGKRNISDEASLVNQLDSLRRLKN